MTGRVGSAIQDDPRALARARKLSGGLDAVPKRKTQRLSLSQGGAIWDDVFSLSHSR